MLDNLVFYYNNKDYDLITKRLHEILYVLRVTWDLCQGPANTWKQNYSFLVVDPLPMFITNFYSYGEDSSLRAFALQYHWFEFVNSTIDEWGELEKKELDFMLQLLNDIEIKRWHFEITISLGRSKTTFEKIVSVLKQMNWEILHLQPDNEKILFRDKFLLWHLVSPNRKLILKGYVTNSWKYPPFFENMTKTELVLPVMSGFEKKLALEILEVAQNIRKYLFNEELAREGKQIVWAKSIITPNLYTWFNNSNALNLSHFFLKFGQENIPPYPTVYATTEETLQWLNELLENLSSI